MKMKEKYRKILVRYPSNQQTKLNPSTHSGCLGQTEKHMPLVHAHHSQSRDLHMLLYGELLQGRT